MDDLVALSEGLRRGDPRRPAPGRDGRRRRRDRRGDRASRWNRRIAGDARKRNRCSRSSTRAPDPAMTIKWVKVDPLVMNGEPFCYGTRLTVRQLLELRANGYD